MPMIAKAPIKGATKGKKQYSSPIGPEKDPKKQKQRAEDFYTGYQTGKEQARLPESFRKDAIRDSTEHLNNREGMDDYREGFRQGIRDATKERKAQERIQRNAKAISDQFHREKLRGRK